MMYILHEISSIHTLYYLQLSVYKIGALLKFKRHRLILILVIEDSAKIIWFIIL